MTREVILVGEGTAELARIITEGLAAGYHDDVIVVPMETNYRDVEERMLAMTGVPGEPDEIDKTIQGLMHRDALGVFALRREHVLRRERVEHFDKLPARVERHHTHPTSIRETRRAQRKGGKRR